MSYKIELLKTHLAFPGKKVGAKITIDDDLLPTARNLCCTGYAKWIGRPLQRAERKPTRRGVIGTRGMEDVEPDADDAPDK